MLISIETGILVSAVLAAVGYMFRLLFTQIAKRIDERFETLNARLLQQDKIQVESVTTLQRNFDRLGHELQQIHAINIKIAEVQGKLALIDERTRKNSS